MLRHTRTLAHSSRAFCLLKALTLIQFHSTLPPEVYTYPISPPEIKTPIPLRKYGFHGLSYANILKSVSKHLGKSKEETNLIVCHLGSGASMCCIKNGKSLDTTVSALPRQIGIADLRVDGLDTT